MYSIEGRFENLATMGAHPRNMSQVDRIQESTQTAIDIDIRTVFLLNLLPGVKIVFS